MTNSNKIILNTIVLYIKVIVCTLLSLWSVRIVFQALGADDFGLYNLIAGVIAMLAFLSASMTVATQRFLSVSKGERNDDKYNKIYNTSIILHVFIGLIVVGIFELTYPFIFDGFLNIHPDKIHTAKCIFQLLVMNMYIIIITVPFNAVLNADENMFVYSIIAIIDAGLKLAVAFILTRITSHLLEVYSIGVLGITIFTFLSTISYVVIHYKKLHIALRKYWDKTLFHEMLTFCWWNTFGGFAMACKNQGIAIVQNLFFGTLINAAMGIANQINGVLCLFSSNIQKSINPQLMMSEGENDIAKRTHLTYSLSKFSTLALSVFAIPLIVEMPFVLRLWLDDVPEYTIPFSRLILIASLIYQLSSGLMSAIQSNGDIKFYQIIVSVLIVMNIPLSYLNLKFFGRPEWTLLVMIAIEVACLVFRLITAHFKAQISIWDFIIRIILPIAVLSVATLAATHFITILLSPSWGRLMVVCSISVLLIGVGSWLFVLTTAERNACVYFIKQKIFPHV